MGDKYFENFFAPFFFSFLFLEFSSDSVFNSDIKAKGRDVTASDLEQGKRNIHFPMTIRHNQSVLVNELKSKFEAIDQRFDTLFECLNGNGNNLGNSSPKPVISNSESQVINNQILEVLEQWTGRHTQNYYKLKYIFQFLNVFAKDQYQRDGINLVLKRAREVLAAGKTSWNIVLVIGLPLIPFKLFHRN